MEALVSFLKKNRPQKTIKYEGKQYHLYKILKYLNESNNLFDPYFYQKTNLIKNVDIDDIPDGFGKYDLRINSNFMLGLAGVIAGRFGVNKTIYVIYLDKGIQHPIGMALTRDEVTYYHRRIKNLYVRKTTPLKFAFIHQRDIDSPYRNCYLSRYGRISLLISAYKYLSIFQKQQKYITSTKLPERIEDYIRVKNPTAKRWKGYPHRDVFINRFAELLGIGFDIWNPEFYKINNMLEITRYSKIRFSSDYSICDVLENDYK